MYFLLNNIYTHTLKHPIFYVLNTHTDTRKNKLTVKKNILFSLFRIEFNFQIISFNFR